VGEKRREFIGSFLGIVFLLFFTAEVSSAQERWESLKTDQCLRCHTEDEMLPADLSKEDVHLRPGLSCAGCHGGDATAVDGDAAMSREAGIHSFIVRRQAFFRLILVGVHP